MISADTEELLGNLLYYLCDAYPLSANLGISRGQDQWDRYHPHQKHPAPSKDVVIKPRLCGGGLSQDTSYSTLRLFLGQPGELPLGFGSERRVATTIRLSYFPFTPQFRDSVNYR